jgi:hypothetical protein
LNKKKKTLFSFFIFERGSLLFEGLQTSLLCPSVNISFGYENEHGAAVEVSTTLSTSSLTRAGPESKLFFCCVRPATKYFAMYGLDHELISRSNSVPTSL